MSSEEMLRAKEEKKYFKIVTDNRDLNYSKFFTQGNKKFKNFVEYNSKNTNKLNDKQLINILKNIGVVDV